LIVSDWIGNRIITKWQSSKTMFVL